MMGDYRDFDQLRTNELFVTRHKWFFPYYELTDGHFVYAKLSYKSAFKKYAVIETAQGMWTIKREGLLSRTQLINQGEDKTIGNLIPATWKRNMELKMDNGFEATYLYKKLFSKSITLVNSTLGDMMQITARPFGIKKPFMVSFDKTLTQNNTPPLPLLAMIGVNVVLVRQQHAAAAH